MLSGGLPGTGTPLTRRYVLGGVALLAIAACLAYWPALKGEFVLDDDGLLTDNVLVKASDGLSRMWFTLEPVDYWPVTNSTLWLEWRLWGMNPVGYHVTNLLLHVAAALLIWANLRALGIPGAFLAALLFVVHPVNVESVAWISQRKDALAIVFFLLSILWYLRAEQQRGARNQGPGTKEDETSSQAEGQTPGVTGSDRPWYWLSLLGFVLALLSKGSVAILPLLLLLIVWWQRRRIGLGDLARTAPFFLVAVALTAVNLWFRTHGADIIVRDISFSQRLVGAGTAVWFYLSKGLTPIHLSFSYPQWQIESQLLFWWLPLAAAFIVTLLLGRNYNSTQTNWGRALLFAWVFFCVALVPVLGFTDVGFMQYSPVADHYQHIAIIALSALAAAAWSVGYIRSHRLSRLIVGLTAVIVVGLLTLLSRQQSQLFSSPITLYEATIKENPGSWFARNNLGIIFGKYGRTRDAKLQFDEALRLNPDCAMTHYNLGNLFRVTDKIQDSIAQYQLALKLQPNFYDAHNNLGSVFLSNGRPQEAAVQFREAAKCRPDSAIARYNFGNSLVAVDQSSEAIYQYNRALQLRPDFAEVHSNLGFALAAAGQLTEGIRHLEQAIRLQPNLVPARRSLGFALANAGRPDEAIEQYNQAAKLDPNHADDHFNLGNLLTDTGKFSEAIEDFHRALELKPDYQEAEGKLALALLNAGRPEEALDHCQKALQLRPNDAEACANMAIVYDQLHKPAQAIATAEKALDMARSQGRTKEAKQIEIWLDSYRSQQSKPAGSSPRASQSAS